MIKRTCPTIKKKRISVLSLGLALPILIGLSGNELQLTAYAQEYRVDVVPSSVCAGSNYCVPSITPTIPLTPEPTSPVFIISPVVSVSPNPCISGVAYRSRSSFDFRKSKHKKKHKKTNNGVPSMLMKIFQEMFNQMFKIILLLLKQQQTPAPTPTPTPVKISPTATPSVIVSPSATVTIAPTSGPTITSPVVEPTMDPCAPTPAPTIIVQPTDDISLPTSTPSVTTPVLTVVPLTPAPAIKTMSIISFYAYPDISSSAGAKLAHPVLHQQPGGTGTYADPITFAVAESSQGTIPPGTKMYIPYLERYFIMEDDCHGCTDGFIDLWLNSTATTNSLQLLACKNSLIRQTTNVQLSPQDGLSVSSKPLFDTATNTCFTTTYRGR